VDLKPLLTHSNNVCSDRVLWRIPFTVVDGDAYFGIASITMCGSQDSLVAIFSTRIELTSMIQTDLKLKQNCDNRATF
jgi:hypothetical protein